jgi:hypothetical protein
MADPAAMDVLEPLAPEVLLDLADRGGSLVNKASKDFKGLLDTLAFPVAMVAMGPPARMALLALRVAPGMRDHVERKELLERRGRLGLRACRVLRAPLALWVQGVLLVRLVLLVLPVPLVKLV